MEWGAWGRVGMAHGSSAVIARAEAAGLGSIPPELGLGMLARALMADSSHPLVRRLILFSDPWGQGLQHCDVFSIPL